MAFFVSNQEDTLLRFGTLHFIVLNDELLLQHLDSIKLLGALGFGQHDLSEVTFTKDSQEIEVIQANPDLGLLRWSIFFYSNLLLHYWHRLLLWRYTVRRRDLLRHRLLRRGRHALLVGHIRGRIIMGVGRWLCLHRTCFSVISSIHSTPEA